MALQQAKQVLWEEAYRPIAAAAITRFLTTYNGQGWPGGLQLTLDEKALPALATKPLTFRDIAAVIKLMLDRGLKSIDNFEQLFCERLADPNLRRKEHQEWIFYIPMKLSLKRDAVLPSAFTVHDQRFTVLPRWRVATAVGDDVLAASARGASTGTEYEVPRQFLKTSTRAATFDDAWQIVGAAFDVLRGLIEISLNYMKTRYAGSPMARSTVRCPRWLLAISDGGEREPAEFFLDDAGSSHNESLAAADITRIQSNMRRHRRLPAPQSLMSLLADCLRLYIQAMDARFNDTALLAFWQVGEALSLAEDCGGDTKRVCARLAWFTKSWDLLDTDGLPAILRQIAEKRNRLVHRGMRGEVDDDDVNILKLICEGGMSWLRAAAKSLPTVSDLRQFYSLCSQRDTSLASVKTAMGYLKKLRKHPK